MGLRSFIRSVIQMTKEEKVIPIAAPVNTTELLKGKTVLITGGSGGIGSAIAEACLRNSAKVIIAGTRQDKLDRVMEKLQEKENLRSMIIDLKDVSSFEQKVQEAADIFGEIDILINSAGLLARKGFLNMTEEEYDSIMDVNAKGTYFMVQAVAKHMIDRKIHGHILNIASSASLRPAWNPYQMSKWAVRGFTLGASEQLLPYGIIVNALAPGPVATEMLGRKEGDTIYKANQPSKRYAVPSELANMAVILVSDLSNLVVGDTLFMTGGSGNLDYHN